MSPFGVLEHFGVGLSIEVLMWFCQCPVGLVSVESFLKSVEKCNANCLCLCACACVCMCACVLACVRACVRACMRACVDLCVTRVVLSQNHHVDLYGPEPLVL